MEDKTNWFNQIIQMLISILAKLFNKQDIPKAIEAAVPSKVEAPVAIKVEEIKPVELAIEPIKPIQAPQITIVPPIVVAPTVAKDNDLQKRITEARNKAKASILARMRIPRPIALNVPKKSEPALTPEILKTVGAKKVWIPWALDSKVKMPTQGFYKRRHPVGMVLHCTSGRSFKGLQDAENNISDGAKNRLGYLIIARDGELIQPFSLDRWTYHAGKSFWPGLGEYVHSSLLGVEVCNAGPLTKRGGEFISWFGEVIPSDEVHHQETDRGNIKAGYYHKYTPKQIATIKRLAMWLKKNAPDIFKIELVLGHDEVSPGRKIDPGGALLGQTMRELRIELLEKYKKLQGGVLHG